MRRATDCGLVLNTIGVQCRTMTVRWSSAAWGDDGRQREPPGQRRAATSSPTFLLNTLRHHTESAQFTLSFDRASRKRMRGGPLQCSRNRGRRGPLESTTREDARGSTHVLILVRVVRTAFAITLRAGLRYLPEGSRGWWRAKHDRFLANPCSGRSRAAPDRGRNANEDVGAGQATA